MFSENVSEILNQIQEEQLVIDIGGWAQPFARANYVIDIMPYETRGMFGTVGEGKERFSKDTWVVRDLCDRTPFPFEDKSADYVICSHTLEDCRDPLYVCSEINRIGKRGYIEVPSRFIESTIGVASQKYCGYSHHRWLVEIEGHEVIFAFKPHMMHEHWKYHIPKRSLRGISERDRVAYLFWEGSFSFRERIVIAPEDQMNELKSFVESQGVYPSFKYKLNTYRERAARSIIGDIARMARKYL